MEGRNDGIDQTEYGPNGLFGELLWVNPFPSLGLLDPLLKTLL